jgi:putative FmdB family regulatory protein
MPTYDYRCDECGEEFEVWQSITDDPFTECPRCGRHIRKVMSPAGIVLKGSGFYKTDNRPARTGDDSKKAKGDGDDSKKARGDGEKKSESKPDKKADTKAASSSKD